MRRRRGAVVGLAATALLTLGAATPVGRLELDVQRLRSARGSVLVCLTADPDNFPSCVDDAQAVTRSIPAGQPLVRFDGLTPGQYAAAVIHDENGNARLDTLAGVPREGFGFSRNPRLGFGPPKFAAARFAVAGGDAERQQIRMRYIF